MYGIPNMKLEKDVIERKINIMEEEGVTFETCSNVGKDIKASEILKDFDRVILACGASNPRISKFQAERLTAFTLPLTSSNQQQSHFLTATSERVHSSAQKARM